MAKHGIRANKTPEKPKAEIRAAKSFYETTHPVGSAERFLDEAAQAALLAAAAGGIVTPKGAAVGAVKAVADKVEEYPDPLLAEAAKLSKDELAKRAAQAALHHRAMEAQNAAVRVASAVTSPAGNMATNNAALAASEVLDVQQAAKGGDTSGPAAAEPAPSNPAPAPASGPRIVINPTTFKNSKDALCVAFNEGFRLWMEATNFEPQSEPTNAQRKFFSDTAYADDEVQLRRTILARIATFDTSVKDPTDDQLAETGAFLDAILESDWCKNDWERNAVSRLSQAVKASVGAEPVEPKEEPLAARPEEPLQSRAALGGGETEDEEGRENTPIPPPATEGNTESTEPTTDATESTEPEANATDTPEQQNPVEQPQPVSALHSGVFTGGADGSGRELTQAEAEWMQKRITSGASVSGQQLAMFGLARNEQGALVNQDGTAFGGFGGTDTPLDDQSPDTKLDTELDSDPRRKKPRTSTPIG